MMRLKPFNSFGRHESAALVEFFGVAEDTNLSLSGYLAGRARGGYHVIVLETEWAKTFGTRHAIACNSATSGLLAAAFAAGLKAGDKFVCPAMTMSATAAAPMFTGATPIFIDISEQHFGIDCFDLPYDTPVFATNLFGHPADLARLRKWCDLNKTYMVEDNSQSPFATANRRYTGTIGHIGVFSLNVHKPLQCGEGGVIVTDDDDLALRMRDFINHGENAGGSIGLNLRMTEVCAVLALAQLRRGGEIVARRTEQARAILSAIGDITGVRTPVIREGCSHVFYTIPFLLDDGVFAGPRRSMFCAALRDMGVPIVEGYVEPLYRMPAFAKWKRPCPVAEDLHDRRLFYFENCAWDPTPEQIRQIGDAFRMAAEKVL